MSSSRRRRRLVNSLPCGKAVGGVFCGDPLVGSATLVALARLRKVAPNRVFAACRSRLCVAGAIGSACPHSMRLHFSWQAWRLGDIDFHFAWQAQYFVRVAAAGFR